MGKGSNEQSLFVALHDKVSIYIFSAVSGGNLQRKSGHVSRQRQEGVVQTKKAGCVKGGKKSSLSASNARWIFEFVTSDSRAESHRSATPLAPRPTTPGTGRTIST